MYVVQTTRPGIWKSGMQEFKEGGAFGKLEVRSRSEGWKAGGAGKRAGLEKAVCVGVDEMEGM